jgi:hypothetical protein
MKALYRSGSISILVLGCALAGCSSGSVTNLDAEPSADAPQPPRDGGVPRDADLTDRGLAADASAPADAAPAADATPADAAPADATSADASADAGPSDGAGPLVLLNATATFSQTNTCCFPVTGILDRTPGTGWAIHPNESYQAAAVETSTDTPRYPNGTVLTFRIDQSFATEHAIGRVRLAYTTRPRTEFADGNDGTQSPGDVGSPSVWTVPRVQTAVASNGATLSIQADQSILAEDLDSTDAVYTVTATVPGGGITGFRIEVLNDPSLPFNGPGLQDTNGNFVLNELEVRVDPRP